MQYGQVFQDESIYALEDSHRLQVPALEQKFYRIQFSLATFARLLFS